MKAERNKVPTRAPSQQIKDDEALSRQEKSNKASGGSSGPVQNNERGLEDGSRARGRGLMGMASAGGRGLVRMREESDCG